MFANGVRALIERMPATRTTALALWLDLGSRDETPEEGGVTHFIEHMLFKGSRRRDVFSLARAVNSLGGHVNAFTTPEHLCLHATVIAEDQEAALDLLAEMLLESIFPADEMKREREVILEEISESEDQPEDLVEEQFYRALWNDDPLGRPVIGRRETVSALKRKRLLDYWRRNFTAQRLLVVAAGAVNERKLLARARRLFGGLDSGPTSGIAPRTRPANGPPRRLTLERDLEQAHFVFGTEGPGRDTPDRFVLLVMNTLYGGGMGSRLFNEIREKRGLAYSVWSTAQAYRDVGTFEIRGSASPEKFPALAGIAMAEWKTLLRKAPSRAEVENAKKQCVRSFILAMEAPAMRAHRLAEYELSGLEILSPEESIRRFEAVTARQTQEVAKRHFEEKPMAVSLVGQVNGHANLFESLTF